jgi:hypothetical protein
MALTGEKTYFATEASVFCLPKADNLIICPAFLMIIAAKEFFVDHYNHGRDRKNLIISPLRTSTSAAARPSLPNGKDQTAKHPTPPLAASRAARMI